jgi:hypothetical protein
MRKVKKSLPRPPTKEETVDRPKGLRPKRPIVSEEAVDESSILSFPASDPPSWTPLHAGSPRKRRRP